MRAEAPATTKRELYDQVTALRSEVFELLDDLGHQGLAGDAELVSSASVALQNVANQLGAVEHLIGPSGRTAA